MRPARAPKSPAKTKSAVNSQRAIQRRIDDKDRKKDGSRQEGPMQAGTRRYPAPPLPKDHLEKPGLEADLSLKPMYDNAFG